MDRIYVRLEKNVVAIRIVVMQIWDLAQLIRAQTTKIYDSLINFLKIIWIKWYTLKFEQTKLNLFLNKSSRLKLLKYKSKKILQKREKFKYLTSRT